MNLKLGESFSVKKTIASRDGTEKSTETSGEERQEEQERREEHPTSVSLVPSSVQRRKSFSSSTAGILINEVIG